MKSGAVLDVVQPRLPLVPPTSPPAKRFWRLVRETATGAYALLKERLPSDERVIYVGIAAYYNRHQRWPTSRELFEYLVSRRDQRPRNRKFQFIRDINNVSPRLTDMSTHGRRVLIHGEKRACTSQRSAGRVMLTWKIPQVGD